MNGTTGKNNNYLHIKKNIINHIQSYVIVLQYKNRFIYIMTCQCVFKLKIELQTVCNNNVA